MPLRIRLLKNIRKLYPDFGSLLLWGIKDNILMIILLHLPLLPEIRASI